MQVVVDGLLTSYQRSGKGKQVLILHGWGDAAAGWQRFAAELSKKYEVVTPDLPGFGGTQAPGEAWGLDEYAQFVASFINKLQLKPYVLIGHSNGGGILVRGLGIDKLPAEKLVLIASAGIRNEYKGRNKALRLVTKAGKAATAPLPKSIKSKLRRKVYATIGSDMLVAEHLQETFKKVVEQDVQTDAEQVAIPTLLIYGEKDESTPVRYGELFHQAIDGSQLEIIPGAGHFVHLDRPAQVVTLVEDFIR